MSPTQPTNPAMTIEESLEISHRACDQTERLIETIWGHITGENSGGTETDGPGHFPGLAYSATVLSQRQHAIVDRLGAIAGQLASPRVVGIASQGSQLSAANAQASRLNY